MKVKNIIISVFLAVVLAGGLFFLFIFYQKNYGNKVITEVWLGNYSLKGLTKEEVKNLLEKEVSKIEENGIKFYSDNKEITIYPVIIALSDPDLTRRIINFKIDQTVENIFLVPQKGILKFFQPGKKQIIHLVLEINDDEIIKILKSNFKELEKPPKDAALKYVADDWKIIPEEIGLGINYQEIKKDLENNLSTFEEEPILIKTIVLSPKIYKNDIELSLEEVEKISKLAPVDLFYGQEKWTVTKESVLNWIDFNSETGKININLDEKKIQEYLVKLSKEIDRPVQEAKFKLENNRVTEFRLAREGRKLEIETSAQKIKNYLLSNIKEIELEVVLEPAILTENVNNLGIKELVGRGESNFKGSPNNRIHNIKIGAKTLNGVLIKPGEEFSLLKNLGDVSQANGYLPELVIKGDRTIPELGGGLCQIGTTTFRVALNAGLPIAQRAAHAFRVVYYEPAGMDATIYNPSPDFKFINDYSSWLLLQTKIDGTKLIFELYGAADGRKVELTAPKIYNLTSPGPVRYVETETMAPGTKRLVERATLGADAEFTRTITPFNGEPKEEIWKSHYRPWPEMWLVGKEPTPPAEAPTPEANQNQ